MPGTIPGERWEIKILKVKGKNQPQTKGNSDLDDYDFGDEEDGDYAEFEQYDPASDQEGV